MSCLITYLERRTVPIDLSIGKILASFLPLFGIIYFILICSAAIYVFQSITTNRKNRFSAKIIPIIPSSLDVRKKLTVDELLKSAEIDEYEDDDQLPGCLSESEIDYDLEDNASQQHTERATSA